jgi:hypothetical protein
VPFLHTPTIGGDYQYFRETEKGEGGGNCVVSLSISDNTLLGAKEEMHESQPTPRLCFH